MASIALATATSPAAAGSLSGVQGEAARLSLTISAGNARLDLLGQRYESAQGRVLQLSHQLAAVDAHLAHARWQVALEKTALHQLAVNAYEQGGTLSRLAPELWPGSDVASATGEYRSLAIGNLRRTLNRLHHAELILATQHGRLGVIERQLRQAASQIATAAHQAQVLELTQQMALSQVRGQVAAAMQQQQAAAASANRRVLASTFGFGSTAPSPSAAGQSNSAGSRALQAAQSQLGVPYQWGAESPGRGFDCSGLTQWAWRQAGVAIPRTAAAQYAAVTHVPMADLQPGDLVFWYEHGTIGHVAMYVGNGEVIHAPGSGQRIRYQAIWARGLAGAGRP